MRSKPLRRATEITEPGNIMLTTPEPLFRIADKNGRASMTHLSRRSLLGGLTGAGIAFAMTRAHADGPLTIATSMPLLQDIVANIAGDQAEVFSVMPNNADPHTWEPTPENMVRLTESDAFIFFSADLEPFVESGGWRQAVSDNNIPELQVTDHVDLIEIAEDGDHEDEHDEEEADGHDEHDHGNLDPHIWLDPLTMVQAVPAIAEFLAELDTANAETIRSNAESYVTELEELHAELEETLGVIPEERRKLLVFHDAWKYFASRYGFEVVGIVLENPNSEVSAQEMANLLKAIDEHDVNVIFAEPQLNVSALDLLVQEGDVEIEILLTDSFIDGVDTYAGLMRFNRDQLVESLAG